jgi:hypothetical protein
VNANQPTEQQVQNAERVLNRTEHMLDLARALSAARPALSPTDAILALGLVILDERFQSIEISLDHIAAAILAKP